MSFAAANVISITSILNYWYNMIIYTCLKISFAFHKYVLRYFINFNIGCLFLVKITFIALQVAIEVTYVSLELSISVKLWHDRKFRGELKGHIINNYASIDCTHARERTAVMYALFNFRLTHNFHRNFEKHMQIR